ncbi:MAG: pyridoxal phosphate-dependent decarboxylase family protein [Ilumatobacteraceae bacterium]
MTPDEFRAAGHAMVDRIAAYLDSVGEQRIVADIAPGDVYAALPPTAPTTTTDVDTLMADIDRVIIPNLSHWQHPGWFAYFPANTSYASILAELLSAGLGVQGMSWVTSPAATEVETLMCDWMLDLLDLPRSFRSDTATGGGVIQGSASEATLVAILAARWRATQGTVNDTGDTSRLVAYRTAQAHSSIDKGLRIAGIGEQRIRTVAHDADLAMDPADLARQMAADVDAGLQPFFVCSTHGTTSTLAMDPTAAIADAIDTVDGAGTHRVWLHVDAAMAGIAALDPDQRWVNDGVDRADSYCTNPHKWMGVNFDCTLFWTVDRHAMLGALSIMPAYLRSAAADSGAIDYRDWQIPLGRRFRALKLLFVLRLDGVEPIIEMLRHHLRLANDLAARVAAHPRLEIAAPPRLGLVCLSHIDGDAATDALIDAVNASGRHLVTRTEVDGRSLLRVSIGARTTAAEHVDALWDDIHAHS